MRTYLVGGAVRDIVLGRKPKDHDYVVVGSTVQEMLDAGFQQVGKDFPTFLHPETKDEYALARTEKSCGIRHTDFVVNFDPEVTLDGKQHICLDKKLLDKFLKAGFNIYDDYTIEQLMEVFQRKDL